MPARAIPRSHPETATRHVAIIVRALQDRRAAAPFTGAVREFGPKGEVVAEDKMIDGLYEGLSQSWYPSGPLRREAHFLHDSLHGPYREWHENGQLKNDGEYEHRICTWMKAGTRVER